MKPELSLYCQRVDAVLTPFVEDLQSALNEEDPFLKEEDLLENFGPLGRPAKDLASVLDKVRKQSAFVLIFGPLKSGKSTLMNALSRAYVSEVTALPAYPCLVYVKYSKEPWFKVNLYNGETARPANNEEMNHFLEREHRRLVEEVRKAEEAGEVFDPAEHFPEAIESFEIGVPAEHLEEGQTVVVDTPGLYSRMKFGYDLMTREFRDRAACAVFVVKSDNLFLEQVFAEFGDLLALFSRIFLVVNIDSQKKDLGPDGQLRPSLEARSPGEIVQAFESYAMSAALRRAYQDGRLKIFPIDLLTAASKVLQGENHDAEAALEEGTEEAEEDESAIPDFPLPSASADQPALSEAEFVQSFASFERNLTDYLNGSDYLNDFREDTHRRILTALHTILDEMVAQLFNPLESKIGSVKSRIDQTERKKRAIQDLSGFDWKKAMSGLPKVLEKTDEAFIINERKSLQTDLSKALTEWMENDQTFESLLQTSLNNRLEDSRRTAREKLARQLESTLNQLPLGFSPDPKVQTALRDFEVNLGELRDRLWPKLLREAPASSAWTLDLDRESIPVKKSFWDILLFRGRKAICRKLFAKTEEEGSFPSALKQKRFGESARVYLQELLDAHVASLYPRSYQDMGLGLAETYARSVSNHFQDTLKAEGARLTEELPQLKLRVRKLEETVTTLNQIRKKTQDLTEQFQPDVAQQFGRSG
jgi:energy-coupling factor transporter ATP-binding protein EcfA2